MERPELQRLLADVGARKIDVVIVYKVDRLTRSLTDFAKIVETFDRYKVSFVSVTQQFNTTTSMGRLTLNVLLSFAQFEREVTSERIRDKIAASKAKGMWMGGFVSLGYDVKNRKLVVNEAEARTVRHIFRRYAELGSVRQLKTELDAAGIRSKARVKADGTHAGSRPLARGALYAMLQNPIFRGQIRHKDKTYPGEHEPIVDVDLWDAVQTLISGNRVERKLRTKAKAPSPLAGLLFDAEGKRMTPTHAVKKNGRRYRYYVSLPLITNGALANRGQRIPAQRLESLVAERLSAWLVDSATVQGALGILHLAAHDQKRVVERAGKLASELTGHVPTDICRACLAIIARVQVHRDRIEISLNVPGLMRVSCNTLRSVQEQTDLDEGGTSDPVVLKVPVRLRLTGIETRLVMDDGSSSKEISESIVRLLVRAYALRDRLFTDTTLTAQDVAAQEGLSPSYVTRLLRLTFLAPSIVDLILTGRQPPELTARRLLEDTRMPLNWAEQHKALGFG